MSPDLAVAADGAAPQGGGLRRGPAGLRLRLRRAPIAGYPLVIAAALVVRVWVDTGIHPASMLRPLIVAVLLAVLITLVCTVLSRSRDLGALASTAVSLWLIAAVSLPMIGFILGPAVLVFVGIGLSRRGRPWPPGQRVTHAMTVITAITAIAVLLQAIASGSFRKAVSDIQLDLGGRGPAETVRPGDPDIYLILLDAYPGADAAALDPHWDAAAFGEALRDRGFDVAARTHSNYLQTPLTVASVFDMRHLVDNPLLDGPWQSPFDDGFRLRRVINDAAGLALLHRRGYELTTIASGYAEPELRRVDRFVEPVGLNEFEVGILRGTGAGNVLTFLAPDLAASLQRERIRGNFEALALEAIRVSEKPRLIFAHFPAPHAPWVFDADGHDVHSSLDEWYAGSASDRGITRAAATASHLEQSTYIAALTLAAVDRILAAADSPPVIVVFSDHGPGSQFDQTHPFASDLVERTSNILAVYTPGHPGLFAKPTTPVNILPKVLNAYLDLAIPEQPDTIYAWRDSRLDLIPVEPTSSEAVSH